jgi:anti-anti-sigma regulatory factor
MVASTIAGPIQGMKLETPQEIPGISTAEIGVTDRVLWDGARLFGDSRTDEFRSYIRKIRDTQTDSGYAMGFGMLRIDGDKDGFEDLAVEYAVNLGKSPPTWLESHTAKEKQVDQTAIVRVKTLTQDTIIATTISLESPWPTVIDLAEVTKVDSTGIDLFNDCLSERIARKDKTRIINGEKLIRGFRDLLKTGKHNEHPLTWAFCFTYYKVLGEQAAFDGLIADYMAKGGPAIKWSDESWKDDRTIDVKIANGFTAGKTLSAVNIEFANRLIREGILGEAAKKNEPITVDFSSMKSGSIFDMAHINAFLKACMDHNAKLNFINVNEIIFSILKIIGVDKFVKISTPGTTS